MREALQSRNFGLVMYAYRYEHRPVITQAELGRWLNMTQAQVSRLERGPKPPSDLDKLARWALVLHIPESLLWFKLPARKTSALATPPHKVDFGWFGGRRRAPVLNTGVQAPLTVDSIRETTAMFRGLDNRFGGGHARGMVGSYLAAEIAPAMYDHRPGRDQVEFVSAVAEVNQLAGWMAYDVGDALSGRRHLQHALQLCQRIGDQALAAEMLAGMSHQAAHARNGTVSVGLAQAARDAAAGTGFAALESETAVMEAHGLGPGARQTRQRRRAPGR
ncbi:helix-turn-helix domain-containing protein [Saccharopolyspora hattusasensis]|uniref:helix-turn-helix domain-containing protein n=1 Tax=Saccharopolyspora hattusasensis TaxID=1128679 RepID=UPI003D99A3BA